MSESISEIVARTCWQRHSSDSVLLALLSPGLDTDGVIAHLALRSLAAAAQSRARFHGNSAAKETGFESELPLASPIFFVLVSDNTETLAIHRIAEGLRLASSLICASLRYAELLGTAAPHVHAVEEGSSPKQRSEAFLQGGIVVMGGRFFCADVLHHRVTLHFSLVGAVVYVPCLHRHWLPVPSAPRRVAKHLASLAFATELLCARNAKLNRQSTSGVESYASTWGWGTTTSPHSTNPSEGPSSLLSQQWLLKAPLFFVSDHPPALLHCLRSRTILEGRVFLKSFHVGVMEVFPRFRLDIVKQFERPQSLRLDLEPVTAAMSPIDAALTKALRAVVQEVLDELSSLEVRLATPSVSVRGAPPIDGEPRRKQQRVDKDALWSDAKRPCGVHFARVLCDDALSWGRNGLEAILRDALASNSSTVAPYRRLLLSLGDVLYLAQQLPLLAPGTFLIVLENLVTVEERIAPWGVGGANTVDSRRPLWTLSDRFSDIVQLASSRVFEVVNTQPHLKVDAVVHYNVDSDDDEELVVHDSGPKVPTSTNSAPNPAIAIKPPTGSPGEYFTLIKSVSLGWVRSMVRKVQQHRLKNPHASIGIPSMLLVVEEESTLRQLVLQLCMDQQVFAQMELERFLLAYKRLHGNAPSIPTPMPGRVQHHRQRSSAEAEEDGAHDERGAGDDDDDEFRGGGDVAEHILTQHRATNRSTMPSGVGGALPPRSQSSPLNAAFLHTALLSQPLTHASLLTALDDDNFMDAVVASQLQSAPLASDSVVGGVDVHCVGKVDGCVILAVTVRRGLEADVVMLRLVNASYLTPQTLLVFWHAQGPASAALPTGKWDNSGVVPPVGRIVLCSPTLRTLRVVESFQDLVTAQVGLGAQPPTLKIQILHSIPPSTFGDSSAASDVKPSSYQPSTQELAEENATFHQLLLIKSMLTEVLFVDRDSRLETEQHLMSGLSRGAKLQMSTATSLSLAAMPMYLRLRRTSVGSESSANEGPASSASSLPLVIFDEREFRSSLPYHLYCQGFEVLPLTLLHGDYLLSSSYALERKSIPDLIQSLNSGRIYHQLSSLSRIFAHPVLLVEFTKATAFRLSAHEDGTVRGQGDVQRRLMSCLAGNPRVQVVWSRSAQHTATLGMRIRQTFADASTNADPADSSLTQKKENEGAADSIYAMRVLRTFPGVDGSNMTAIMNAAGSLAGLASLSQAAVTNALGPEKGSQLYKFLHGSIIESV
jgi:DNA excision repair protein ERCC-4